MAILGIDPMNHAFAFRRGNQTCLIDIASDQPQHPMSITNPFIDWYLTDVTVPTELTKTLTDSLGGGGNGGFFIS